MNKARKAALLDVSAALREAIDILEDIKYEESDAFDNLPESLQYSSRGDAMQDAIDLMDSWGDDIETIAGKIDNYAESK